MAERLAGEDFLLSPEAFVLRCAACCGADESALSELDVARFAEAIRGGRPKLEIFDAVMALAHPNRPAKQRPSVAALRDEAMSLINLDVLMRFAPGDDSAFARLAFEQILKRFPTSREILSLDFDLRRGGLDRPAIVERFIRQARVENVPVWTTGQSAPFAGPEELGALSGTTVDAKGRDRIVFVRQELGHGWLIAPDFWRQKVEVADEGWRVKPGFLLSGPRRNLAAGSWRLEIDIVQDDDATLVVDVVANSGLDTLCKAQFQGIAYCGLQFEIAKWHGLIEVRLLKPEGPREQCWVRLRNISLVYLGSRSP